jgi:pimeloyl-ACP methyl ester carboxylesterase
MKRSWKLAALVVIVAALPLVCGGEHKTLSKTSRRRLPGSFASLKDGTTCYDLQGSPPAEAVVFVHGMNTASYAWGRVPALVRSAGYLTLVYDLYGRGFSDRPWTRYDLDLFDRQLGALLKRTRLRAGVHLVGSSMGAIVATEFALRHPEMVASLTLVGPAGFSDAPAHPPFALTTPIVGDWLMQVIGSRMLESASASVVYDKRLAPELERRIDAQLEYAGYKRAILSTMRHVPVADFRDQYAKLGGQDLPVNLIWGAKDAVAPFSESETATRLIAKAELHRVEDAGHLAAYEKPEEVAEAMLDFIRKTRASLQERVGHRARHQDDATTGN